MKKFSKIRRSSTPDQVADQIVRKILSGDLLPGQKLPSQQELTEIIGVGKSSIREAINALAVMGWIEVRHGVGMFIQKELPSEAPSSARLKTAISSGSILELMEIRQVLETNAVQLAAQRRDDTDIQNLTNAIMAMKDSGRNYPRFLEADIQFHESVANATGNRVYSELMKVVMEKVVAHHAEFRTSRLSTGYWKRSIHTAENVVTCIENQNGKRGSMWMLKHLQTIQGELKEIV